MISWESYTTSKVLPTFVGESIITGSTSRSGSSSGEEYGQFATRSVSYQQVNKVLSSPVSTYVGYSYTNREVGVYFGAYTNEDTYWYDRKASVTCNSTIHEVDTPNTEQARTWTATSPLATVHQQTTGTESYERGIRRTKTISQEENEYTTIDLQGEIWTATTTEQTLTNGSTTESTIFLQTTTKTTETVVEYVTTEGTTTIVSAKEESVEFLTYTATDGDVRIIAHTIWEGLNAAIYSSPTSETPVTKLSYSPTRFTVSFSEEYIKTLSVRDASLSTKAVTTNATESKDHETTTRSWSDETFLGYYISYESRTCSNRTGFTVYTEMGDEGNPVEYTVFDAVFKKTPVSYEQVFQFTIESDTTIDTTTTTFQTFNGKATVPYTDYGNYTTGASGTGDALIQTSSNYVENTTSETTSTFLLSGDLLISSSQDWPGLVEQNVFPWSTYGDGNRRYFNLPKSEASIITTTSIKVNFGHTYNIKANTDSKTDVKRKGRTFSMSGGDRIYDDIDVEGAGGTTSAFENKSVGSFFEKIGYGGQIKSNNASEIKFDHQEFQGHGLANPSLDFTTDNTHSTLGAFMSNNAQHTWEGFPVGQGIERGDIMPGVVGAVPLYPKFSGLIRRDSEGWELCDTSEYTSVKGSRIGKDFTTTIEWQTVKGTITENSTSSGSFSIDSFISAKVGAIVPYFTPTIMGGFETPNASRTVIVSPGAIIITTYDSENSGTTSTQYPTGTSYETAPIGAVPISISSFIERVQGCGVFIQRLIDNGLP